MRFFLIFLIIILGGCTSKPEQVYICGDHTCSNKKEMLDYFNNNISIEVYTITSEKEQKKSLDLVELNLLKDDLNKKKKVNRSLFKTKSKENIKKVLEERKKIAKIKDSDNKIIEKETEVKKTEKILKKKKTKPIKFVRLCKNEEECDIDKISEIIKDMGKSKPYPNISSQ